MSDMQYWARALRYYARVSFLNSFPLGAAPLAVAFVFNLLTAIVKQQWAINWKNVLLAAVLGGSIFLLTFFTAIGDDIYRNWGASERRITWNRLLVWRVFLYLGALFFLASGFLAYHKRGFG